MNKLRLRITTIDRLDRWFLLALFALAGLVITSRLAQAHGGFEHVMGTVTSVSDNTVSVKTTDGRDVQVRLDAKTAFLRGAQAVSKADLKVNDRVVIDVTKQDGSLLAHQVKLGSATKKAASAPSK